ncbi:E3 SUMO-protein ligase KIAA1586-like [Latimeria chalumnae]|uniref:E3 SUMO-protein ligase KIAA1586-like n=1 Tax=Latimeria chalumnae TaxID=7897 RepID=UPI00313D0F1A
MAAKQKSITSFFRRESEENKEHSSTVKLSDNREESFSAAAASDSKLTTQSQCNTEIELDTMAGLYPCADVWTEEMWKRKKETYPWIDYKDEKLGCKVCANIGSLSLFTSMGLRLSNEWRLYKVSYNGSNRSARLKSLRKKIVEHKLSKDHITAQSIAEKANKDTFGKICDNLNASHLKATCAVFRSAYYLAQNDRPYSDHFGLLELQNENGVDMGIGLHSRYSAAEIIDHIATEMRKKICQHIKVIKGKISILIDESTSLSSKTALVVYLKCESDKKDDPHFMFLDLIELPDQKADTIAKYLLECLQKHGFDDFYLKQNLVAFASDGASVMLGTKSGVAKRLMEQYPDGIIWHCLNHRLELAVGDSVTEVSGVNHFHSLMDKLYSVYNRSPLNQRQLAECAAELEQQISKIGRILSTRWVASSFQTVSAVWRNYEALCAHFELAMKDETRSASDRKTYEGLLKRISSKQFLLDLALMYDTLHELGLLSECLQKCTTTIVYADKLILRSIRFLRGLKERPGTKTLEAKVAVAQGKFRTVSLGSNSKIISINYQQFLTSLINNLENRMFTTMSLKGSHSSEAQSSYASLIDQLRVLDQDCWPAEMPPGYGESAISSLCKRFKLSSTSVINAFRDYVEEAGQCIPQDLQPLLNCTQVIPSSTAECE